jgi:hypothetical protein
LYLFLGKQEASRHDFTLDHDSVLRGSLPTPKGSFDLLLMRVWPDIAKESAGASSEKSGASGAGFLVSRSGLLATNWHVVADAKNISVAFPGWNGGVTAEIVIRDAVNDLAVLRLTDHSKLKLRGEQQGLAMACDWIAPPARFHLGESGSGLLCRVGAIGRTRTGRVDCRSGYCVPAPVEVRD